MRNLLLFIFLASASCEGLAATPVLGQSGVYKQILLDGVVTVGNSADDIWLGDGSYPFQSAAVVSYMSSSSSNDAAAGTGCRTIYIEGVDSSYNFASETATLNGTSAVALANSYLGVNFVKCATVGSGGLNAGQINVGAYNTALQIMAASKGQSQSAIYTAPADKPGSYLVSWGFSVGASTTAQGAVELQMMPYGGSWQVLDVLTGNDSSGRIRSEFGAGLSIPPKASLRLRILSTGTLLATGHRFNGMLEILQKK